MSGDDIVIRLRAYDVDGWEGADEIERLRDEINRLTEYNCELATGYVQLLDQYTATRLERDRLAAEVEQVRLDIAAWREARREQ